MQDSPASLYGNVLDKSPVALLLIDCINDLDFPESRLLLPHALRMARTLARVKARAKEYGCPAIYVNDNFGRWRSDFKQQVNHCLEEDMPGKQIAEILYPGENDYFVLKPAHSGFFSSSLEVLLQHLQAKSLVIGGIATNICVLFTANDAFMRGYDLYVPRDCVAANTTALTNQALAQMKHVLKAHVAPASRLPWRKWFPR
jgi:nicotinamidase-related amidase